MNKGETLTLVGESGCGKSVTAHFISRLLPAPGRIASGSIFFEGEDLTRKDEAYLLSVRGRRISMIFQDPYSSLNPRKRVGALVEQPLKIHGTTPVNFASLSSQRTGADDQFDTGLSGDFKSSEALVRRARVDEVLEEVGINPKYKSRFPHQFSGGQRQRIGIARALAAGPEFVVCDEAVSALDVSVQAQILNLLMDLKERHSLTYLFISHDLSVVEFIATRVLVMYLGKIVEEASSAELVSQPLHPYSRALYASYPAIDPRKRGAIETVLEGDVPSPINPPSGCHFAPRCAFSQEKCRHNYPPMFQVSQSRKVACWLHEDSPVAPSSPL